MCMSWSPSAVAFSHEMNGLGEFVWCIGQGPTTYTSCNMKFSQKNTFNNFAKKVVELLRQNCHHRTFVSGTDLLLGEIRKN